MHKTIRFLTAFLLLLIFIPDLNAAVSPGTADSLSLLINNKNICDSSCANYSNEFGTLSLGNTIFTILLIIFGAVWLFTTYKKKYIIVIATALGLAVIGTYLYPQVYKNKRIPENCPLVTEKHKSNLNNKTEIFQPPGDEFSQNNGSGSEEFVEAGNEFSKNGDSDTREFSEAGDEFSQESNSGSQEFSQAGDEFSSSTTSAIGESGIKPKTFNAYIKDPNIYEPLVLLLIVALISVFIKYPGFRKFRGVFLLAGIVYLGFLRGGCPCMISSFQNSVLIVLGVPVKTESLVWFLTIILGSYLFGRIWCGWLCHLGALQEFLFKSTKINFLRSERSQKILKIINISVFIIWILQLIITRSNLFCLYDPFKVAYNLISPEITGYILLAILLISSVLIYRPFCRTTCPVGLIMSWITYIPGSKKIEKEDSCINCKKCDSNCDQRALIHENKKTILRKQDCILCGNCFSECSTKHSLKIMRKR